MSSKTVSRRAWLIIGAITLAYVVALIADLSPYVRGPEEWRWPRWAEAHWDRVWPLAVVLFGVALLVRWIDRRAQREAARRWIAIGVVLLILAAPLVQLTSLRVVKTNPFEALFDRAVDVVANSYFTAGLRLDNIDEALRTYPQLMPTLDIHAQVHPPGLPLIYWAAGRLFAAVPTLARPVSLWFRQLECNDINLMLLSDTSLASALAGMLLPLLANMLTVWCVFKLAKDRFGGRAGLYAAALWVVVPSAVLFPGSWSLVYPCLACLTWLAVDAGLRRRNVLWFLGAGLLLSFGTFLELGTAALAVFLVLYILAYYVLARRNPLADWRFLVPALIVTLLGVFSIWIAFQAIYGVSLRQIVEAMYPIHVGYEFDRVTWIFNHPYEFAIFVGLPVFCLVVIAFWRNVTAARSGGGDALSISFLLALIGLSLFDPARDETARTWMLFMPLAVVVVSQFLSESQSQPDRFSWLWGLMMIQVATMAAVLEVMMVGLAGLPPRATIAALPAAATEQEVDFGGMAQLIGYEAHREGQLLTIDWYWQRANQVDHPYVVFNHVLAAQGQIAAQQDSPPQAGQPLMTCWQPNEVYQDRHVIDLKPDLPPGPLVLEMGLYSPQTNQRVPVLQADGTQSDHVVIELP
jgi:4-amino-4-deoxy-L-arabinose transferase-like glycosyltransferase